MSMIVIILLSCSKASEDTAFLLFLESEIIIPKVVNDDIELPNEILFDNQIYQVEWLSSNEDILNSSGRVTPLFEDITVRLTATIAMDKKIHNMVYEVVVLKKKYIDPFILPHRFVQYAKNIDKSKLDQLTMVNDKLELINNQIRGYYSSNPIHASLFSKMVGSWSAISSIDASIELQVRVMVEGEWSQYLSYRSWGFGRNNFSLNTKDHIAKLSIDEIIILNNKKAEQFQYQVILEREDVNTPSPQLDLVAFALTIPDYNYQPEISDLPNFLDYEVPMLNQQAVPRIGGRICSPTSATMLLLFKGHDLSKNDGLPHRYIAGLFKDYGADIYGNWVFNTVGISSFGEKAYVGMMYSFEELMHHLVDFGPVAASVSGDMGLYSTGGHLVVVRGYRITDDGDIFVLVNDPNINERFGDDKEGQPLFVYYEYPLEVFMNTWKGIVYMIE